MEHRCRSVYILLHPLTVAVIGVIGVRTSVVRLDQALVLVVRERPCALRRRIAVVVEDIGKPVGAADLVGIWEIGVGVAVLSLPVPHPVIGPSEASIRPASRHVRPGIFWSISSEIGNGFCN